MFNNDYPIEFLVQYKNLNAKKPVPSADFQVANKIIQIFPIFTFLFSTQTNIFIYDVGKKFNSHKIYISDYLWDVQKEHRDGLKKGNGQCLKPN